MDLNELRQQIDTIDNSLLKLLNERLLVAEKIKEVKKDKKLNIYLPERENEIIDKLQTINDGKMSDKDIRCLFSQIFSISRSIQQPQKTAFLGPKMSFTHQAGINKFGTFETMVPIGSIKGIFEEVSRGNANRGIVPIENSSNGIVTDTINCLNDFKLNIVGEIVLDIHLTFASLSDNVANIQKIYSKDIAFGQCRRFLANFGLSEAELIPVESTVKAVEMALTENNAAAICPSGAALEYQLPILYENIEDNENNKTRFFVISDFEHKETKSSKTSILAKLSNEPGELVKFLNHFEKHDINLTKIKSHIIDGESLFFIEINGHRDEKILNNVLNEFDNIKILGSYPKEVTDI